MRIFSIVAIGALALAGCDDRPPTSAQKEQEKQEQLSNQAIEAVGMPGVTNFAEKRMMKSIIELRDKQIPTYTYILDLQGHTHFICNSVGYGLPYATQFTNPQMPQRVANNGEYTVYVLPQADPNGLYSPASADGTWVLCMNPETKNVQPVYIEPHVIVSPFKITL